MGVSVGNYLDYKNYVGRLIFTVGGPIPYASAIWADLSPRQHLCGRTYLLGKGPVGGPIS